MYFADFEPETFRNWLLIARCTICSLIALAATTMAYIVVSKRKEIAVTKTTATLCIGVLGLGLTFAFFGKFTIDREGVSADAGSFRDYLGSFAASTGSVQTAEVNSQYPQASADFSEILQTRVKLRMQLRNLHDLTWPKQTLPLNQDVSITDMTRDLANAHVLDAATADDLTRFASVTHFIEWGNTVLPGDRELDFARTNGPALVNKLADIIHDAWDKNKKTSVLPLK